MKEKNEKSSHSFKNQPKKVGKEIIGMLRTIPKWVFVSIIPFLVGVGLTLLFMNLGKNVLSDIPEAQTVVLSPTSYNLAYDGKTRGPSWVLEIVTPGDRYTNPEKIKFIQDSSIPPLLQTNIADFENSGYDIVPLAIYAGEGLFDSKFPLSLCSPMLPKFSQVYWEKLESHLKDLIKKINALRVLTITGPLYLPNEGAKGKKFVTYEVIGKNNVAVPTHFFKAIFYPADNPDGLEFLVDSEIYVIPNINLNESVPLESFRTSLEDLQKMSGIIFPKDIKSYLKVVIPAP